MSEDINELAKAVARLARRLRQERDSELTASQLSVLGAIKVGGCDTPGAIAAHERVAAPTATRMLNCLADDGLISRSTHAEDGRQVLISISDKGERILAAERDRRNAWFASRLATLDINEREALRAVTPILLKLADA